MLRLVRLREPLQILVAFEIALDCTKKDARMLDTV